MACTFLIPFVLIVYKYLTKSPFAHCILGDIFIKVNWCCWPFKSCYSPILRNLHCTFHINCASLPSHQQCFPLPISVTSFVIIWLLDIMHYDWGRQALKVNLICISLRIKDMWELEKYIFLRYTGGQIWRIWDMSSIGVCDVKFPRNKFKNIFKKEYIFLIYLYFIVWEFCLVSYIIFNVFLVIIF